MPNFAEGLRTGLKRSICSQLQGFEYVRKLTQLVDDEGSSLQAYNWAAALRRLWCNELPPADFPEFAPGGQCENVLYYLRIREAGTALDPATPGLRFDRTIERGPFAGKILGIVDANTSDRWIKILRIEGGVSTAEIINLPKETYNEPKVGIVGIRRDDDLPDDCGNPPTYPPAPTPVFQPVNINVTYNNNQNVEITVPVTYKLQPIFIDVNGQINIPVNVKVDAGVSIDLTFNVNEDKIYINVPSGDPDAPTTDRSPPGAPGGENPRPAKDKPLPPPPITEPPDVPPSKSPLQRVCIGCVCTIETARGSRVSVIGQLGANPDVYVPRLGIVNFKYQTVDGAIAWGEDIAIKNIRQFIPSNDRLLCVGVEYTLENSVGGTVTPLYVMKVQGTF